MLFDGQLVVLLADKGSADGHNGRVPPVLLVEASAPFVVHTQWWDMEAGLAVDVSGTCYCTQVVLVGGQLAHIDSLASNRLPVRHSVPALEPELLEPLVVCSWPRH